MFASKQGLGYASNFNIPDSTIEAANSYTPTQYTTTQSNTDQYGLPRLSATDSASDNFAALTRAQYNDWLNNTYPKYQELLGLAQSESFVDDAVAETKEGLDAGFKVANEQQERDLRRYGLTETARQREHRLTSTGLQQTAARTSAANSSRLEAQDMQNIMLAGGLGSALNQADQS